MKCWYLKSIQISSHQHQIYLSQNLMCGAQELNDKKPIINSTPDELHDPGNFIGLKTCYHHRRIAFRNQL